jgi:hypothetical protein
LRTIETARVLSSRGNAGNRRHPPEPTTEHQDERGSWKNTIGNTGWRENGHQVYGATMCARLVMTSCETPAGNRKTFESNRSLHEDP